MDTTQRILLAAAAGVGVLSLAVIFVVSAGSSPPPPPPAMAAEEVPEPRLTHPSSQLEAPILPTRMARVRTTPKPTVPISPRGITHAFRSKRRAVATCRSKHGVGDSPVTVEVRVEENSEGYGTAMEVLTVSDQGVERNEAFEGCLLDALRSVPFMPPRDAEPVSVRAKVPLPRP